jgi:hypothetical protein
MENCFFLLLHGTLKKRKGGGKKEREREKKKKPRSRHRVSTSSVGEAGLLLPV